MTNIAFAGFKAVSANSTYRRAAKFERIHPRDSLVYTYIEKNDWCATLKSDEL